MWWTGSVPGLEGNALDVLQGSGAGSLLGSSRLDTTDVRLGYRLLMWPVAWILCGEWTRVPASARCESAVELTVDLPCRVEVWAVDWLRIDGREERANECYERSHRWCWVGAEEKCVPTRGSKGVVTP